MAQEIFIDTHLDFVYSPLNVSYGIVVEGNVASEQTFDQSDGTYLPDYGQTYLVLKPWMRVVDPDEVLAPGEVQMANMHWYVYDGTAETEIANGTQYQIASDGRLSIRRNVDPGKTLLFRFRGEYQDPRTGEVWKMEDTHSVFCDSESAPVRMILNQPELVEWDPTSGIPQKMVLSAALFIGPDSVPAANREFVWEKKDAGDADFMRVYPEGDPNYDLMDYDVALSADGTELTLKRELMGHGVEIRCRAKYDPYGNPSGVTLNDRSPSAVATFTRNLPTPDVVLHTITNFKATMKSWKPSLEVYIGKRLIENPERFWRFNWYLSKGNADGTISRTLVGEGVSPTLPTSYIVKSYGATLQVGFIEKEPPRALLSGGKVLTTGAGAVLVG